MVSLSFISLFIASDSPLCRNGHIPHLTVGHVSGYLTCCKASCIQAGNADAFF
jgi:hypothetical protein